MSHHLAMRIWEIAQQVERLPEISAPLSRQDEAQRLSDALSDVALSVSLEHRAEKETAGVP